MLQVIPAIFAALLLSAKPHAVRVVLNEQTDSATYKNAH